MPISFVALDRGYYRDAGLEVKIVRGQGDANAIRQIAAGNAMFGFADPGNMILARANDRIPVKLVAIVYRKPPQAIFCREDSGLRMPKDLEGNAIGTTAGASVPALFPAFAKAAGIDARTVRWVLASIESLPGLLATNKVSCVGQFTPGEALLRSQYGPGKLVRFAYSDAGLSYYGSGIVATDATIASKPDLVRRFGMMERSMLRHRSWCCCLRHRLKNWQPSSALHRATSSPEEGLSPSSSIRCSRLLERTSSSAGGPSWKATRCDQNSSIEPPVVST